MAGAIVRLSELDWEAMGEDRVPRPGDALEDDLLLGPDTDQLDEMGMAEIAAPRRFLSYSRRTNSVR